MEQIVVLTGQRKCDGGFLRLLESIFTECEILTWPPEGRVLATGGNNEQDYGD